MHKLIALLFSSKAWNYEDVLTWNDVTKVPSSHDSRTENNISEQSPGSSCKRISTLNEQNDCIRNEHLKFCEPDKNCTTKSKTNVNILENIETRDSNSSDRGARIAIQSPLKKRLKFTKDYESVPNNHDDTKTPTSDKDKEVKDQIHSDGLHLLLSILEEENKKALLSEHCTRDTVSNVIVDEKNNFPENKSSTITSEEHKAENCVEGNTKNSTNSIIYQALVSKNENKIDQGSGDNIARTSLEENSNGAHDNLNRKNNGKQRKRKVKNIGENSLKRKSGSLKKKENKGEVIGVQDGYMCNKCKIFFDNLSSFQEHMQSTHSKKFRCIACDFMTIKIRYFIDHLIQNRHDGTICSICHFQTSTNEELHKHILKHESHLPRPFFCNDCDKTFPTKRSWSVHLPVHSNETQFLCAVCSKGFKWSQGLENHMSTHVNEKLYLCNQCDFHTANRAYLAKHTLKHYNKKEVCPHEECKHREIRRENLKAHLLTHSKVKRFQCELCGKSFAQARNLDRHLESVHNPHMTELSCNQCNYLTIRLDKLKDHFKSRHKMYDYTQYIEQLKEKMKTKSTQATKVNRHLLSNSRRNVDSHVEVTTNTLPVPLTNNQSNASALTLPVLNQDGLFRVNNLENKTALPIIINVNKMTASNVIPPFVKAKHTICQTKKVTVDSSKPRDPRTRVSKKNVDRIKPSVSRSRKTMKKEIKPNTQQSETQLKKILPLIKPQPQPNPIPGYKIGSVLTSTPIFLIISPTPQKTQVIGSKLDENLSRNNCEDQQLSKPTNIGENDSHQKHADVVSKTNNILENGEGTSGNDNSVRSKETSCKNRDSDGSGVNFVEPPSLHMNQICYTGNDYVEKTVSGKNSESHHRDNSEQGGNYFDILDESTGELVLLTSKHMNNPFLDEATGELSVFEIPSSFINYIENLTSSEYDNILDDNEDPTLQFLLDEEHASWSTDNQNQMSSMTS
ncbi:hypothetical protein M8J75_010393 [Diaphorina citri]|nr:hypothetical protein M8J75_010393 [Diaphorina citri]